MENHHNPQLSAQTITKKSENLIDRVSTYDDEQHSDLQLTNKQDIRKTFQDSLCDTLSKGKIRHTEGSFESQNQYCRICLENQITGKTLISPCNCKSQVHDQCLLSWIDHRDGQDTQESLLTCEICKERYRVDIVSQYCLNFQICKERNKKQMNGFIGYCLLFTVMFLLFASTILIEVKLNTSEKFMNFTVELLQLPKNTVFAVLCILSIIFGVFSIGLGYKILGEYLFGVQFKIKQRKSIT